MEILGLALTQSDIYLLGAAGSLFLFWLGIVAKRDNGAKTEKGVIIKEIITPFNDALVNIEHGEHNHIAIMNTFFAAHKEAVSRAKAISRKRNKKNIQKAWNQYNQFYESSAKSQTLASFMNFPEEIEKNNKKVLTEMYLEIIKAIKKA